MSPNIICLGELLVEIMRTEVDTPHGITGASYKGPFPSGAPAIFIDSATRMSKSYGWVIFKVSIFYINFYYLA